MPDSPTPAALVEEVEGGFMADVASDSPALDDSFASPTKERQMVSVSAYFYGGAGDPLDKAAHAIFRERGCRYIGAGNWMVGPALGERDVEYDVPDDLVEEIRAVLKKAGFRLEPTPIPDSYTFDDDAAGGVSAEDVRGLLAFDPDNLPTEIPVSVGDGAAKQPSNAAPDAVPGSTK